MEKLREEHEAGLLTSIQFLKALLVLAKDAAQMMKQTTEEADDPTIRGKAALTELFQNNRHNFRRHLIYLRTLACSGASYAEIQSQ